MSVFRCSRMPRNRVRMAVDARLKSHAGVGRLFLRVGPGHPKVGCPAMLFGSLFPSIIQSTCERTLVLAVWGWMTCRLVLLTIADDNSFDWPLVFILYGGQPVLFAFISLIASRVSAAVFVHFIPSINHSPCERAMLSQCGDGCTVSTVLYTYRWTDSFYILSSNILCLSTVYYLITLDRPRRNGTGKILTIAS